MVALLKQWLRRRSNMATLRQATKIGKVMREFKDKALHSGKGGKVVKGKMAHGGAVMKKPAVAKKK